MPGTGPRRRSSAPVRKKAIVGKSLIGAGANRSPAFVLCFQPPIFVVARWCGCPIELAKLVGRQISKRTMWPHLVILSSPILNDHACFGQGREEFAIQTLVAKLIVKALDISLFPGRTRLDVQALNLSRAHPFPDRLSDELRAIVTADMFRLTVAFDRTIQDPDGIQRSNGSAHLDRQTLLSVFIDKSQDA